MARAMKIKKAFLEDEEPPMRLFEDATAVSD
jgi:hypothetical protein